MAPGPLGASVKLNLGAGECWTHAPEPWVNVDSRAHLFAPPCSHLHVVGDFRTYVFDSPASGIYAGHLFEHIPPGELFGALDACHRLLSPGADMLVVGPDAKRAARMYADGLLSWGRMLSFGITHIELEYFNQGGRNLPEAPPDRPEYHRWVCTEDRMRAFLEVAGFVVRPGSLDDPDWPVFDRGSVDQFALLAHRQ